MVKQQTLLECCEFCCPSINLLINLLINVKHPLCFSASWQQLSKFTCHGSYILSCCYPCSYTFIFPFLGQIITWAVPGFEVDKISSAAHLCMLRWNKIFLGQRCTPSAGWTTPHQILAQMKVCVCCWCWVWRDEGRLQDGLLTYLF